MPQTAPGLIERRQILAAREAIAPYIRRTPVLKLHRAGLDIEAEVTLKLELLQHAGSFKSRGAFANLLLRPIPDVGVVAASGGNHGAAVAYAAMTLGIPARIYIPAIASPAKVDRIRSYRAQLVIGGEDYGAALEASEEWAASSGALKVHAFDQEETLCGQGTLGAELQEQAAELDTILAPVGGGGLLGGIASWYAGSVRLVGIEPEGSPTLTRALRAGHPVDAETRGLAADSLAPRRVGDLTFPILQRHVEQVVLVSDDDIRAAQTALWSLCRIVAEPGGAAAFAALLTGRFRPRPGEQVGVVITGGSTVAVDFARQEATRAAGLEPK